MSKAHEKSSLNIKGTIVGLDDSVIAFFPFKRSDIDIVSKLSPITNLNTTYTDDGIAIEAATTNLVSNGDFANSLTGWAIAGSYGNATIYTTRREGKTCLFQDTGNWDVSDHIIKNVSVTAGATYTISFSTYALSGRVNFDPNGPWNTSYLLPSAVGEWRKSSYTFTPATSGTESFNFYGTSTERVVFYMSEVQVEQKPFPTSFTSSSRGDASLVLEIEGMKSESQWSLIFDYKHPNITGVSNDVIFASSYDGTTGAGWFGYSKADNQLYAAGLKTAMLANDVFHRAVFTYDGTTSKVYLDGKYIGSPAIRTFFETDYLAFGSLFGWGSPSKNASIIIRNVGIYGRALPGEEVAMLYNSEIYFEDSEGICT